MVQVMSNEPTPKPDFSQPMVYQIRVKSHLSSGWTDWFDGLSITLEDNGNTLLTGPVIDQAALYGVLKKVRDLGMPLISVNPLDSGEANAQKENENKGEQISDQTEYITPPIRINSTEGHAAA
jgi:hypothetical protein